MAAEGIGKEEIQDSFEERARSKRSNKVFVQTGAKNPKGEDGANVKKGRPRAKTDSSLASHKKELSARSAGEKEMRKKSARNEN